jgi:hypothetical protein
MGTIRNVFDDSGIDVLKKKEVGWSLRNELNAGPYPITNEVWNSVPADQTTAASIARVILETKGWQAAAGRDYVKV